MTKWKAKRWKWGALSIALLPGCTSQGPVASAPSTPTDAKSSEVTLFYQSNRYGTLDPCGCSENAYGGADREANAIRAIKNTRSGVLFVDSGNLFSRPGAKLKVELARKKGLTLTTMLNTLGLDVASPGPGDYALGLPFLKEVEGKAKFRFVSSNVVGADGNPVFAPYAIEKRGDVTFGILALSSPAKLKAEGLKVLSPEEALAKWLPEVKEKSQFVVVLSQLDTEVNDALPGKFPDVRVVVGTDPLFSTQQASWLSHGRALLVDAADNGFRLGRLDLSLKLPFTGFYSPEMIADNQQALKFLDEDIAKDPAATNLKEIRRKLEVNRDLAVIPGGTQYHHELISLDAKRFGTPNELTKLIADEKERVRREALGE